MKLSEKIAGERKKRGWSQEELAERLGVSRQAVSKWESGQSVPDLTKILGLSEVFGVTTDYLLKESEQGRSEAPGNAEENLSEDYEERTMSNYGSADPLNRGAENDGTERQTDGYGAPENGRRTAGYETAEVVHLVTQEEAEAYLESKETAAPWFAGAVALCILSPALLILLAGLAESGFPGITEGIAGGIGLTVLLVMVGVAVFFFVWFGTREKRFEYLRNDVFVTEPETADWIADRKETFGHVYGICLAGGVVGCIISAIPVVIAGVSETGSEWIYGACVAFLLVIVAVSVAVITWAAMIKAAYDVLLQNGEFKQSEKKGRERRNALSSFYWCLITAGYLAVSFSTGRWDRTWIIWAVSGVLYAALEALVRLVTGKNYEEK